MNVDSFPKLVQFLGAYFHQDWLAESGSWEAAVDLYREGADREEVRSVYDELTSLRAQFTDEEILGKVLFQLGSFYAPARHGVRPSDWVQALQRRLVQGA